MKTNFTKAAIIVILSWISSTSFGQYLIQPVFPANNSVVQTTSIIFEWSVAIPFAKSVEYELEFTTDSTFSTGVHVLHTYTNYTSPVEVSDNTTYFWRVRDINNSFGQAWHFTTASMTEISSSLLSENFKFYPNPAKNYLYVTNVSANSKVEIYNSIGQVVKSVYITETGEKYIPISDLKNGIYFLEYSETLKKIRTVDYLRILK